MAQDELDELRKASQGLEYPSESDVAFDIVRWPEAAADARAAVAARAGKGKRIDEVPFDGFFDDLAASEDAERFTALKKTLASLVTAPRIFRVGAEPRIDIYLLGRLKTGAWAGLHTVSVET